MSSSANSVFTIIVTVATCCMAAPIASAQQPQQAPGSQPSDSAIRVQSVRLARSTGELQKVFPNRFYGGDGGPGVSIQLHLSFRELSVFTVARDGIAIDTFVDDTYQSLLGGGPNEARYSSNQPTVLSEDGRHVLFTVSATRPPSSEAGRVFVRGSLHARVGRGAPKTNTAELPLRPGAEAKVGPFRAALKGISDQGENFSVQLAVTGDPGRIRQVRALDKDGRPLGDERNRRTFDSYSGGGDGQAEEQPRMMHLIVPKGREALTLEFTYVEKLEPAKIPFEAQVDVGVAKSGPVQTGEAAAPRSRPDARGQRPWPPPPDAGSSIAPFPPRRVAFNPSAEAPTGGATTPLAAAAATRPTLEKAAVDLFSLTVAKPPPDESKQARWGNPPSPAFRAAGFTVARLMISTPQASILSIPQDGVTVTRFEDDKGGARDTTMYRDTYSSPGRWAIHSSPDGQQALLNVSLASTPTPGASRCTVAGTVRATVARGDRVESTGSTPLVKGQSFKLGPYSGTFTEVRQTAPLNPAYGNRGGFEVWVNMEGPVGRVRGVELLDASNNSLIASRGELVRNDGSSEKTNIGFGLPLPSGNIERAILRLRYYDKAEAVEIPFEVSTGIGL